MTSETKATSQKPGNTSLPSPASVFETMAKIGAKDSKYRVEDFFKMPEVSDFQISPDGEYLTWRQRNKEGKRDIYIKYIETGLIRPFLKEGEDVIRGYGWANLDTIVYIQDKGGDENYHLYAIDLDDKEARDLTPFDGVRVQLLHSLKDDPDHMIIEMNKENDQLFEPYLLNIYNGDIKKLYNNSDLENPIAEFTFDKDANLRAISRIVNGQDVDLYYKVNDEFKKIKHVPFGEVFTILNFDYRNENPDVAYVLSNLESDRATIYLYDLKENKVLREVFSHPVYDVDDVRLARHRNYELDAFFYDGAKPVTVPQSETFKQWMADLEEKLGKDQKIYIVDQDDGELQLIVFVTSDKEPGVYYLYDTTKKEVHKLTELFPHLHREDMSEMTPIEFQSRDGLTIHGYFSRPAHVPKDQAVPAVVVVHGGPQGVRDTWGFSPQTQLFASHGYGVLQVNFRISGGYGKEFLSKGFGQVGRATMDDVEDGLKYVVDRGWVDASRVAIYGGSHGGFAVLRGLVKTPDLYACGIDYVGVSNLYTFMQTIPSYWEPFRKMMYTIWYNPDDAEQRKIMDEVSPLQNSEKITKPLFVVQGANDPRVNIAEADQIVESLRARGIDVPYMVKYDEGHGFAKEPNRLEFQQAMMGFLHQHLHEE